MSWRELMLRFGNAPMSEVYELLAFYGMEPQGEERADLRDALQTAYLLNHLRPLVVRGVQPVTLRDVSLASLLDRDTPRSQGREMTPEEQTEFFRAFATAQNESLRRRTGLN